MARLYPLHIRDHRRREPVSILTEIKARFAAVTGSVQALSLALNAAKVNAKSRGTNRKALGNARGSPCALTSVPESNAKRLADGTVVSPKMPGSYFRAYLRFAY